MEIDDLTIPTVSHLHSGGSISVSLQAEGCLKSPSPGSSMSCTEKWSLYVGRV